jgi:hypothetical protein
MAATYAHWTLEEAIDLEAAMAAWDGSKPASPPQAGGLSRGAVFKQWLATQPAPALGARWIGALGLAGGLGVLAALASGTGAAWGTLERATGGVHVIWFLAGTLLAPWLLRVWWVGSCAAASPSAGSAGRCSA